MGSPKALLDFRGETFINRLIRILSTVCDPVIVVLGHHQDAIRPHIHPPAQFVINPDPDRGQLSSLQTALVAIPPQVAAFMFVPVDCPAVNQETISRLSQVNAPVVIPRYQARHGHPVYATRPIIAELLALPPTAQPRDLLKSHAHYLDVDDPGVLTDIDTPAAYHLLTHPQ